MARSRRKLKAPGDVRFQWLYIRVLYDVTRFSFRIRYQERDSNLGYDLMLDDDAQAHDALLAVLPMIQGMTIYRKYVYEVTTAGIWQ